MLACLSRLNRRRLFLRAERLSNKQAQQRELQLSRHERSSIEGLLKKFTPKACGQDLVRMGPAFDGGYLLPDDLIGIEALYSPGVSDTLGFDLEIAKRRIPCFLADGTVEQPSNMQSSMNFEKMMIGKGPADTFMSLDSWVTRTAPSHGDLMLQMDIEGAEYEVLLATPRALLDRFRIIVLELHWVDRYLFGDARVQLDHLMDRLLENHIICHLHPNNVCPPVNILGRSVPPLIELTLLRKDRLAGVTSDEQVYPHPLDAPNDTNLPIRNFLPFWGAL
jgi:Methyltransferase FkbM domain